MNSVTVNLDNLSENERAQILSIAERANANKKVSFSGVEDGGIFKVEDIEFIKFPDMDGMSPVVAKDIVFDSEFGENNCLAESKIMERLEREVLPKVIAFVGMENLCTIRTDLTTLDGLKPYRDMESFISLPTFDFYRANVGIFDQHKIGRWWWLATPESAEPHDEPRWILCVAPPGRIGSDYYYDDDVGVRPFLLFKSSIFESSGD